jgi:Rad3-related DNA helicase
VIVPNSPQDLGLPFDYWRPYQAEAVQEAYDALQEHDKVLLEAPTGSGKTIIGAALSRLLGGTGLYMAHTKSLQQQQLKTLPGAVTATGRSNHKCLIKNSQTGEQYETALDGPCPCPYAVPDGCSYYRQWFDSAESPDVVLNYAYAVRVLQTQRIRTAIGKLSNPFTDRDLMVCDEAHTLEGALLDAGTTELGLTLFSRLGIDFPGQYSAEVYHQWATEALTPLETVFDLLEGQSASYEPDRIPEELTRKLRDHRRAIELLEQTKVATAEARQDVVVGRLNTGGVKIRPLWVKHQASNMLFRFGKKVLLMSATLGSPFVLSRILGIPEGTWTHIKVPSTFPVQNRPVYLWPVAQMKHGMPIEDKARQAAAIIALANRPAFANTPGVIHCASYDLATFLMSCTAQYDPSVRARMVTHTPQTRDVTFKHFERDPGNVILLTPAATTGVDWDFVSWQVIPKVPYPNLGDDFVRMRYDYVDDDGFNLGRKVFQNEAATAIVQAAGRHVRTPESKGVTVITDAAFKQLYYGARECFPKWFQDAVKFDASLNSSIGL